MGARSHVRKTNGFPTLAEPLELTQQLDGIRGTILELEYSVDLSQFGSRKAERVSKTLRA